MESSQKSDIVRRLAEKGVRSGDIKDHGRLTPDQISGIDPNIVFEWVKTGKWNTRDFKRWLHVRENKAVRDAPAPFYPGSEPTMMSRFED